MILVIRNHRVLQRYRYVAMFTAFLLLVLPVIPGIRSPRFGAYIWIQIGPLSFQPGELAKIALAIFFAGYLVQARDSLSLVGPALPRDDVPARPRPRPDPHRLGARDGASSCCSATSAPRCSTSGCSS